MLSINIIFVINLMIFSIFTQKIDTSKCPECFKEYKNNVDSLEENIKKFLENILRKYENTLRALLDRLNEVKGNEKIIEEIQEVEKIIDTIKKEIENNENLLDEIGLKNLTHVKPTLIEADKLLNSTDLHSDFNLEEIIKYLNDLNNDLNTNRTQNFENILDLPLSTEAILIELNEYAKNHNPEKCVIENNLQQLFVEIATLRPKSASFDEFLRNAEILLNETITATESEKEFRKLFENLQNLLIFNGKLEEINQLFNELDYDPNDLKNKYELLLKQTEQKVKEIELKHQEEFKELDALLEELERLKNKHKDQIVFDFEEEINIEHEIEKITEIIKKTCTEQGKLQKIINLP